MVWPTFEKGTKYLLSKIKGSVNLIVVGFYVRFHLNGRSGAVDLLIGLCPSCNLQGCGGEGGGHP